MLIQSSHSQALSKTHSSFRSRKKVLSLRPLDPKTFDKVEDTEEKARQMKLEKRLQRDLKRCSYLLTETDHSLPDNRQKKAQNKLWPYFEHRMDLVKDKVIIQQANECYRQFKAIQQLINKRKEVHSQNIEKLTKMSKDKYREIHERFQEIKRSNINKLMQRISIQKNKKLQPIDNSDQIKSLKDDIELIRKDLLQIENDLQNEKKSMEVLITQWIALLTSIVNNGYFMPDGIRPVLMQMAKHQHVPKKKDFPSYIDHITYNCIITLYNQLKTQQQRKYQDRHAKKFRISRAKSSAIQTIEDLSKQPQLKHIYQGTRDFMVQWVKNNSWKEEQYNPRKVQLSESSEHIPSGSWQAQQRRRMAIVYTDPKIHSKVKNIMFGPKVESIL